MVQSEVSISNRRSRERFKVNSPVVLFVGERRVPAFTRDLNNRSAYFFVAATDSPQAGQTIEFVVELPPDITLSGWCRIRCQGQVLRIENTAWNETGVAVEIGRYSILNGEDAAVWGTSGKA